MVFPPVVLLADSQALFRRGTEGEPLLLSLSRRAASSMRFAAYLGASNSDVPEFFDLFVSATEALELDECRHVKATASQADLDYLDAADLVVLAGGEVERGLNAFHESGVAERLVDAYLRGAMLVGVSAGAIQLGNAEHRTTSEPSAPGSVVVDERSPVHSGFRFVPFVVDVHAGPEWTALRSAVTRLGNGTRGIGIESGGGALYHRDGALEPIHRALVEVVATSDGTAEALLLPGDVDHERAVTV